MQHVNLGREEPRDAKVNVSINSLLNSEGAGGKNIEMVNGEESYVQRVADLPVKFDLLTKVKNYTKYVGVTQNFKEVIDYFNVSESKTPAGFRIEFNLDTDGVLRADLVRDISYDTNGRKRPTKVLFSVDTANPYEVAPIKDLVANLTCNPGIIYDLFINNPEANVDGRFKTRDEVMKELGRILGPGADISVELNDPFRKSEQEIMEEVEKFKEMLSPYRLVVKVPHTGPVNGDNVEQLLKGDKRFNKSYDDGSTEDLLRGHNLALMLAENDIRVNFTLMFDPHQTALALQARPYFINSFVRQRLFQSETMQRLLDFYKDTEDTSYLEELKERMLEKDYFPPQNNDMDLMDVKNLAEKILTYRNIDNSEGQDGLDAVRHNLRMLKHANLPDTRLIICSMQGDMFMDIDKLLTEDEFQDMGHRILITAVPNYLARFTSSNLVINYQRRFMNAAQGEK